MARALTIVGGGVALALLLGVGAAGYMWWDAGNREQAPAAAPAPAASAPDYEAYTPDTPLSALWTVEVRARPEFGAPVVSTYAAGQSPQVIGRTTTIDGEWYVVALPSGVQGYVRPREFAARNQVVAAPPVATQAPRQRAEAAPEAPPQIEPAAPARPAAQGVLIEQPVWLVRPSARDIARVYPRRALNRGREGRVVLDCTVHAGGTLTCAVANENPRGEGFGDAALELVPAFRMQPGLPDGRSVEGARVRLPVTFRLNQ